MAQVVRQADGTYVAIKGDGTRVPISGEQMARATVQNTQGVTMGERFTLKNAGGTEAGAMNMLRGWGYEVRKWGNHPVKMQFAVRKNPREPWKVVDPDGFEPEDLLDFASDAAIGVGVGLATAATGGLGGAVAAGALAGGGLEAVRQGIGAAAGGGAENFSPAGIAGGAVAGGIAEPLNAGISAAARSVSKIGLDLASRVAGVRAVGGISRSAGLKGFASLPRSTQYSGFRETADALYKMLKEPGGALASKFPASVQMNELLAAAEKSGQRWDASELTSFLENFLLEPGEEVAETVTKRTITETARKVRGTSGVSSETRGEVTNLLTGEAKPVGVGRELETVAGRETASRAEATTTRTRYVTPESPRNVEAARVALREGDASGFVREKLTSMMNLLKAYGDDIGEEVDIRAVAPGALDMLRGEFQAIARGEGVYGGQPISRGLKSIARKAAEIARKIELDAMGGEKTEFARLLADVNGKMKALHATGKAFNSPADLRRFIKKVYGEYDGNELRALRDFERNFGLEGKLTEEIRKTQIGRMMAEPGGKSGAVPVFPRLTATGSVPLLAIGGASMYSMGVPGLAAAVAATSPRTIVAATRLGMQAAKVASQPAVSFTARQAAIQSLRQAGAAIGKGIAREPERPRRRRVVGG